MDGSEWSEREASEILDVVVVKDYAHYPLTLAAAGYMMRRRE